MTMLDAQGRAYAKLNELKVGDVIELDDGFDCKEMGTCRVCKDEQGLYFICSEGHHYLDGQADNGNDLVGVYHFGR